VPFGESIGALLELQREGKIRHIGLSNVSVQQLREAQRLTPIASVQNRYNLADRESDPVLDVCEQEQLAFLPWAPIQDHESQAVREIAQRHGATAHQVALAWLLARSPAMVPIPGTGSVAHLEENVAAAALELSADEVQALTSAR
jgi:pyridoxine 4-dehydrogenase